MELVRRGMDTHRIAETLVVEPVTVRAHVSGALHRLPSRPILEAGVAAR